MDRDRVVLVDRADRSLGDAVARRFEAEGWTVFAGGPEPDQLAELGASGCRTVTLDAGADDGAKTAVDRIEREHGHLDALVLGPGRGVFGPVEALEDGMVRAQFDRDVIGPHRVIRAALPLLRNAEGTVVSVTSALSYLAAPGTGAVSGSARARRALTDALRTEVARQGVSVVGVDVGPLSVPAEDGAEIIDGSTPIGAAGSETDGLAERYGWVAEWVSDTRFLAPTGPWAVAPAAVAATVHDAASAARPQARYGVGPAARWLATARHVPPRWRDRAFRLVAAIIDR